MTDNEIIKALECCSKNPLNCRECGYKGRCNRIDCYDYLKRDALDLINRQQSEIERLQTENNQFADIGKMYSEIKAEAIKEFVASLIIVDETTAKYCEANEKVVRVSDIEDFAKEMVGDNDAE